MENGDKSTSPVRSTDTKFEMMENPMRERKKKSGPVEEEQPITIAGRDKREKKKSRAEEQQPIATAGGEEGQRVPGQDKREPPESSHGNGKSRSKHRDSSRGRERDGSRVKGGRRDDERPDRSREHSQGDSRHGKRSDWEDINTRLRELEDKLAKAAAASNVNSEGTGDGSRDPVLEDDEPSGVDDRLGANRDERHWDNRDVKVRFFSVGGLACSMHTRRYFQSQLGNKCRWVQVPQSVYGATVESLLRQRELKFSHVFYLLFNVLGACLLTFAVQMYILWRLWISLPDLYNNDSFCLEERIGKLLQLCAVGAFLLSVGAAFNDIFVELNIVLSSTQLAAEPKASDDNILKVNAKTGRKWNTDELVKLTNLTSSITVKTVSLLLIFLEVLVFLSVLVVGITYLLVQDTVSNLIQASVAIVFLNDMDNLAYSAIMPDGFKDDISKQYFETPHLKQKHKKRATAYPDTNAALDDNEPLHTSRPAKLGRLVWLWFGMEETTGGGANGGSKDTAFATFFYYVAIFGALAILLGFSVGVVYGLHYSFC